MIDVCNQLVTNHFEIDSKWRRPLPLSQSDEHETGKSSKKTNEFLNERISELRNLCNNLDIFPINYINS